MARDKIIRVPIKDLTPYEKNPRTHTKEQIKQVASSIQEFGFTNPVLIGEDYDIIAGHARVEAAQTVGMDDVPCIILDGLTDEQKRAYVIADNKLAENAGWDYEILTEELERLAQEAYDLEHTGFNEKELEKLLSEITSRYTQKIETPHYEPKGEKPALSDLFDRTRMDALIAQVEESDLDEDMKEFLRLSATRFVEFRFDKIAEYYSHEDEVLREWFDRHALVIVDQDRAIEEGFLRLAKGIQEQLRTELTDDG